MVAIVGDAVAQSRDNFSLNIGAVPVNVVGNEHHRVQDADVILALCQVVIQAAALARLQHLRYESSRHSVMGRGGGTRHLMSKKDKNAYIYLVRLGKIKSTCIYLVALGKIKSRYLASLDEIKILMYLVGLDRKFALVCICNCCN